MTKYKTKLSSPYSPYKAAHHMDKINQLRRGEQITPAFVQIMISDLCNENCSFCAYRMENYTSNKLFGEYDPIKKIVNNNPNRMIPFEKVIETIDSCVDMGIKAIEFTGGGEPTVHPKHREIFEYALSKGIDVGLVTNGVILRDGMLDLVPKFKWIRISVDAANKDTYAAMREVPSSFFDKVVSNIKKIVKSKLNSDSELVIGIGFVVTRENHEEILAATELFAGLGVNNIRISAVFQPEDEEYFSSIYKKARDSARKAVSNYDNDSFRVFNLFGDRLSDLQQHNPEYEFCAFQQFQCIIGGDQSVYRCCNTAYNPVGYLGSIKNQSFKDMWNSEEKINLIENFNAQGCERCMFNSKNRFINYLIEQSPEHVKFI